ncbi:MAG: hypothetical protein H0U57_04390 [Tatlockia sp.]|nr:hypothetical protein [Tatlockia sp.]
MKNRFEIKNASHSSSVGFFPTSSENTHSTLSSSLFSDSEDSSDLFNYIEANPIKISCWRENVCADLLAFTKNKLKLSSSLAPLSSPSKSKAISQHAKDQKKEQLNHALYIFSPLGQELDKCNQKINLVHEYSGRSYELLMNSARTFKSMLEQKGEGNCEVFFRQLGVAEAFDLAKNINRYSPITLLMFLFLTNKYPIAPQDKIIDYLLQCQNQEHSDIFLASKELDNYLYLHFPTQTTLENYQETQHLLESKFF